MVLYFYPRFGKLCFIMPNFMERGARRALLGVRGTIDP